MTELEMLRKALTEAHELGRILVANPHLRVEDQVRVEKSIRTLLSLLYTRLNEADVPQAKLPATIKSDY
jgi:hypothetical protein